MNTRTSISLWLGLAVCGACDPAGDEPHAADSEVAEAAHARLSAASDEDSAPAGSHRVAPAAKQAFAQLLDLVGEQHVDGTISEDELWTGAMEGALERLNRVPDHKINALLDPQQLAELEIGTQGKLVGIGVMIEHVADVVVIKQVIPGGPAEAAKLEAGDRILGVDGRRLRDMDLPESVRLIRGELGTTLELFVQRDTEEWTVTVTRGEIVVSGVEATMLADDTGYARITSFSKNTAEDLDARLAGLAGAGMTRLVLDLRHCPGGLFDAAIATTDLLLRTGSRIVTVRDRDGSETHFDAEHTDRWEDLPVLILIGKDTASGAEILADALRHHDRATLIGERTFGKGTVESIHELDNGWAVKLSKSRFHGPGDERELGVGVAPQLTVPTTADEWKPLDELAPASDPPLQAALELFGQR